MQSGVQAPSQRSNPNRVSRASGYDELTDARRWRLGLAVARTALAFSCLSFQLLFRPALHWGATALAAGFALYSLAMLARRGPKNAGAELFTLILDTIFFLAIVQYGGGQWIWLSSALYIYLLVSAAILHELRDTCVVAGVCTGFFVLKSTAQTEMQWSFVLWGGLLACLLDFGKRRIERRLADRTRDAEDLRIKAAEARERERQRIAGDFHDGPLQSFISFQIRLEALRKILDRDLHAGLEELSHLQELSKGQVRELRAFLREMRPAEVDGDSLASSLRRVVAGFQKESGITVTFQSDDRVHAESPETSLEVLQIVQEALHNVQKHSQATRVAVTVNQSGSQLEIAIEDNGLGFAFSGSYTLEELELLGLGPKSIMRRVHHLGGQLVLGSRPERGAALRVRLSA
jgi:signal transduction histidine kinase